MTRSDKSSIRCQIPCLPQTAVGDAPVPPQSLARRARLVLRRSVNARQVRVLKAKANRLVDRAIKLAGRGPLLQAAAAEAGSAGLQAGDLVRVRSREGIGATLDHWGRLGGVMFMPEMLPYCGTTQRVLKRLERFVDERDYRVKKSKGVVLLEGLICQGTEHFGRCDRSCFYFWREEWLEKIG